jgi:hypothetical protein
MSFFVKSTLARRPKTKNVRPISIGLAAILVVMAAAQLFTFETFDEAISAMAVPGSGEFASVRAAIIVTLEVAAVPFLLGMRLSVAMRVVSMVSGWLAILIWLVDSLWVNLLETQPASNALLGDTITTPVGWWSVFFCLGLGVLAIWAAWGMWPIPTKHKKQHNRS